MNVPCSPASTRCSRWRAPCGGEICILAFVAGGPTVRDIGSAEQGGRAGDYRPVRRSQAADTRSTMPGSWFTSSHVVNATRTLPSGWERGFATTSTAPRRRLAIPPARSCIVSARPLFEQRAHAGVPGAVEARGHGVTVGRRVDVACRQSRDDERRRRLQRDRAQAGRAGRGRGHRAAPDGTKIRRGYADPVLVARSSASIPLRDRPPVLARRAETDARPVLHRHLQVVLRAGE